MKKLFFLFAAAALLASCSSDELNEMTSGGGTGVPTPDDTEYVSSANVEFTNGVSVEIGDLDGDATRASGETGQGPVNFCINLNKLSDEVCDVLKSFGEYKLKADDFVIRHDGVYSTDIRPESVRRIKMAEQDLKVAVKNLDVLSFEEYNDYTFEFYLWIENKRLLDDGTGAYGELFTWEDKLNWIGKYDYSIDDEPGIDLSYAYWIANGASGDNFFESNNDSSVKQCGLLVRYNVYRGLSGRPVDTGGYFDKEYGLGDTPYIKVSVHVEKKPGTTPASTKNECTYVNQ